jgi:hypothetical protein
MGFRHMTLQTFCDLVWLEVWNDCPPMGDHAQYREIVTKLFIEGKPAWEITYDGHDDKGKKVKKRLAPRPVGGALSLAKPSDQANAAKDLLARIGRGVRVDTKAFVQQVQAAKDAAGVASPPDGG